MKSNLIQLTLLMASLVLSGCGRRGVCSDAPDVAKEPQVEAFQVSEFPVEVLDAGTTRIIAAGSSKPAVLSGGNIGYLTDRIIWYNKSTGERHIAEVGPINTARVTARGQVVVALKDGQLLKFHDDLSTSALSMVVRPDISDFAVFDEHVLVATADQFLLLAPGQREPVAAIKHGGGKVKLATDEESTSAWYLRRPHRFSFLGKIAMENGALQQSEVELDPVITDIDVTSKSVYANGLAYLFRYGRDDLKLQEQSFTQGVGGGEIEISADGYYAALLGAVHDIASEQTLLTYQLQQRPGECVNMITAVRWGTGINAVVTSYLNGWVIVDSRVGELN